MPLTAVSELGLVAGREWSASLAGRVAAAQAEDRVLRDALRRLNRRAVARGVLRQRLVDAGHEAARVDRALDALAGRGLLSDEALARTLIEQWQRNRPAGEPLVRHKLLERGLDERLVDRVLAQRRDAADAASQQSADDEDAPASDLTLARRAGEKKARALRRHPPDVQRRRLWGHLQRRGFDGEITQWVVDELLGPPDEVVEST